MPLLDVNDQTAVAADDIVSDGPAGIRKNKWNESLSQLGARYSRGELTGGDFVEVARFGSASGARVKCKALMVRDLPGEDTGGTWGFKTQTWLGEDKLRHSSLYATFWPSTVSTVSNSDGTNS
jgi:hypothetical protein